MNYKLNVIAPKQKKKRLKGILPLGIPQMTSNTHLNIHHKNYRFVYLCVCMCGEQKNDEQRFHLLV